MPNPEPSPTHDNLNPKADAEKQFRQVEPTTLASFDNDGDLVAMCSGNFVSRDSEIKPEEIMIGMTTWDFIRSLIVWQAIEVLVFPEGLYSDTDEKPNLQACTKEVWSKFDHIPSLKERMESSLKKLEELGFGVAITAKQALMSLGESEREIWNALRHDAVYVLVGKHRTLEENGELQRVILEKIEHAISWADIPAAIPEEEASNLHDEVRLLFGCLPLMLSTLNAEVFIAESAKVEKDPCDLGGLIMLNDLPGLFQARHEPLTDSPDSDLDDLNGTGPQAD